MGNIKHNGNHNNIENKFIHLNDIKKMIESVCRLSSDVRKDKFEFFKMIIFDFYNILKGKINSFVNGKINSFVNGKINSFINNNNKS
jgi:hypothetical protein